MREDGVLVFTVWKGGTYGFKVSENDRDAYFSKEWKSVVVELPEKSTYVKAVCNIDKPSFWNDCHELIKKEIAIWLKENGYDHWVKHHPHKFAVKIVGENVFRILGKIE